MKRRRISVAVMGLALATLCGCGSTRADQRATANGLSIEAARQALVELLERSDNEPLKMSLETLKHAKPVEKEPGILTLGPWIVLLKDRRFVVRIIADPIFEEYGGKFEQADGGHWSATIDEVTQN